MKSDSPAIARRLIVHGRVQGVWFRQSTVDRARELGARGWVRNRPDGTVEAQVEGPPEVVEGLIAFCRRGPEYARVSDVEIMESAPENCPDFGIRR